MMEIDEKRFKERIDQTYPSTKGEQSGRGMADIANRAIRTLLATIEEVKEEICDRYCKYAVWLQKCSSPP